jgi:hypothetical protein
MFMGPVRVATVAVCFLQRHFFGEFDRCVCRTYALPSRPLTKRYNESSVSIKPFNVSPSV